MATQTLAMAGLLVNDELVKGVAQDIIDINPIFDVMPFTSYAGQAIVVNRELALGAADELAIAGTITSTMKAAATFTQKTFTATKIIGDAEMDGLVQAQSVSAGVDQTAIEIASKAKNVGRLFQWGMFNGTGASPQMNSLHSLCDAAQYATASSTGRNVSFVLIDELCDLVKAKDGQVDFLVMPNRTMRSYKVLLRALGGVPADWVIELSSGRKVIGYEGIPIFRSEFMPIVETANGAALSTGTFNSIFAGVWDDGSQKVGLSGIYPASVPAGIQVEYAGKKSNMDEEIWRVKWYVNLCLFNRMGLARIGTINN